MLHEENVTSAPVQIAVIGFTYRLQRGANLDLIQQNNRTTVIRITVHQTSLTLNWHAQRPASGPMQMDLTALSGATLVALTSTILFLLIIKAWSAFAQSADGTRFPKSIMLEAAQRYRDELARRGREQSIYLASGLMFTVVFCIAYLLGPAQMFNDIPRWQQIIVLVVLSFAIVFLVYKLVTIMLARRQLMFIRDANMATGHSLQKLTANMNRVFHDVKCTAGIIDNVIVGLTGIYTVSVIAKKNPAKTISPG